MTIATAQDLIEAQATGTVSIEPDLGFRAVQAVTTNLDGFTVRNDFTDIVQRFIAKREKLVFWPLLRKRWATSDPVRDPKEGDLPAAEFVAKATLNPTPNAVTAGQMDLSDPGQAIKALSGILQFGNFAHSLYAQQGMPFGDLVAERTDKMIVRGLRILEQTLFTGDATANTLSFNGLINQMSSGNVHTCNLTGSTPDSLIAKLRSLVRLITDQGSFTYKPTHIMTNGLGLELIEKEALATQNLQSFGPALDVVPGISVNTLRTQVGDLPIVTTPYLPNIDGGASTDTVRFYLVDMNHISWRGVKPYGGVETYDPQIFDISTYTANGDAYLLQKRQMVCYGTLYVEQVGAVYRLDVTVPSGTVGAI